MSRIADLRVKIFADGADYEGIVKMAKNPTIKVIPHEGQMDPKTFSAKITAARTAIQTRLITPTEKRITIRPQQQPRQYPP